VTWTFSKAEEGNTLMRVVGTVLSFLDVAGKRHGYARVPNERRQVFLPGAHIKKVEGTNLREFKAGEEKQFPSAGTSVIIDYPTHDKNLLASKWGVMPQTT
jgi:hypothetical protein